MFLTVSLRESVVYIDAYRGVDFVQPVPNPVVRQAMEGATKKIQMARLKAMVAIYRGEGQKEDILEEIEQVANQELFDLGQIVQQVVGCSVRSPNMVGLF